MNRRILFLSALVMIRPLSLAGILVSADFNAGLPPGASAYGGAGTTLVSSPRGTIDSYQGVPGLAATLKTTIAEGSSGARVGIIVGKFSVKNSEIDLAKLSLGFDLWLSVPRPVRIYIQSFSSAGRATGTRTAMAAPPVAGAFYRLGLDLDKTQVLEGTFDPLAPEIQFVFEINDADGAGPLPRGKELEFRVDNLSFTSPSLYVSAKGRDGANGRTPETALATVEAALEAAGPGDVILIMDGQYRNSAGKDFCTVTKAGGPAAWIVIRPYPGHKPKIFNDGWNAFKIIHGAAYIEIRDLDIQGNRLKVNLKDALADGVIKEKEGKPYWGEPLFNGNGITVDGRQSPSPALRPHHIRSLRNRLYDHCGGGFAAMAGDYLTIEGNEVHDNAHTMRYGGSGISILDPANFDSSPDFKLFYVGNRVFGNRCLVPWIQIGKISDGNGIIADVNIDKKDPSLSYLGRTLIGNNISYGNGGGGIVVTTCRGVDLVHNTVFDNVQSPELAAQGWGDIFIGGPKPGSNDVRVMNNIAVSRSSVGPFVFHSSTGILAENNIFSGGTMEKITAADLGHNDNLIADPKWKSSSIDPSKADFHLRKDSPAIGAGKAESPLLSPLDAEGRLRGLSKAPDPGALEFAATP